MSLQLQPTPLEYALLKEFHLMYVREGFPEPAAISISSRENTTSGRYVGLSASGCAIKRDGYFDLGGKFIEIDGVPSGMMAVVLVAAGQPKILELTAYGGDSWDGSERNWLLK